MLGRRLILRRLFFSHVLSRGFLHPASQPTVRTCHDVLLLHCDVRISQFQAGWLSSWLGGTPVRGFLWSTSSSSQSIAILFSFLLEMRVFGHSDRTPVSYRAWCIFSSFTGRSWTPGRYCLHLDESPAIASAPLSIPFVLHRTVYLAFKSMYAFLVSLFILYHSYAHWTESVLKHNSCFTIFSEERGSVFKKKKIVSWLLGASPMAQWVKNPPAMQETEEMGSIPGSGRFPGEGNGNPRQYSCLGKPTCELQSKGLQRVGNDWWASYHYE